MSNRIVIIPTYNEKENIEKIFDVLFELYSDFHVLIVDDNSPDGTADIVRNKQKEFPDRIHMLERQGKLGLGSAYIAGFKFCVEKGYDFICEMDADFSHPLNKLGELVDQCQSNNYDLCVGSRYVKGGDVKNWSWDRIFLSRGASFYVQAITWMPVKDPTAGFVCYTRKVLENIDLDKIGFTGYAFQIEMKFAAWSLGYKIKEIPITFIDRVLGVSKMHIGIISEAILGVLAMRFRGVFNKSNYKR